VRYPSDACHATDRRNPRTHPGTFARDKPGTHPTGEVLKIILLSFLPNLWQLETFLGGHGNVSQEFSQLEDLTVDCDQVGVMVVFAAARRLRRMNVMFRFSLGRSRNLHLGSS